MKSRYLNPNEFENWDSFVISQENSNVYQTSEWLSTIFSQQNKKVIVKIIACFDKENNIIGGIALGSQKKLGINLIVQPYLSQFSGILISERNTKYPSKNLKYKREIINSILSILEKDHDLIDIVLPPETEDIRPFLWKGFNSSVLYTFRKKLDDQQEIIDNFDADVRRQIKKAQKAEIEIVKGNDINATKDFYNLLKISYKRQKHSFKFNVDELTSIIEKFIKSDSIDVTIYLASYSNKIIAGQIVLMYNGMTYYWLAGGNPEYFNTGANQLLMNEILKDSFAKGMQFFDFVGANTPSIAHYKSTYNFPLIPYYKVSKTKGVYPKLMMKLKETLF